MGQVRRTAPFVFGLTGVEVLGAIYLYDQSNGGCVEIGDVVANRLLPVELHAQNLLAAQARPKASLRIGKVRSQ